MSEQNSSNRRIAKNTLLLYLRMLIVMGVSLYTSRIVLAVLGVTDFGIYNVVGSIVTMFVFLRSALGNATNRYIAFALGKNDFENLRKVFSTCLIVHFMLAILIVILCETIGLWLLYHKMTIPPDRMTAAFWTFQFSVITSAIVIICVPYDADIIAHEKMGAFAFMSILDVSLKLAIVYLLVVLPYDKLILYGLFLFIVQIINRLIYGIYCRRHFEEATVKLKWDGPLVKEMFSFAGWNIIGNMASIGCTPALNVLLNVFFGPVVNAARGVAIQVQSAVNGFVTNFQLAIIPQITKTYAAEDMNRMRKLIISGSKLSYILFFLIAMPLLIEADGILALWLVDVPEHTANFLRIVLFIMILESFERPLHTANLATGKIKVFQSVKGGTLLMMIPIAYVALKLGATPEYVFIIQLLMTFVSLLVQLVMIRPLIHLPIRVYLKEVFFRSILLSILALPISLFIHFKFVGTGVLDILCKCFIDVVIVVISAFCAGLTRQERDLVLSRAKAFIKRQK